MTNGAHGLWSRQRRRATVSLSLPTANSVPVDPVDPVEQFDRAIEIIHRVNRTFPEPGLDREELIALAGLLTQIGAALLTFTDLLIVSVHHYNSIRAPRKDTDTAPPLGQTTTGPLLQCRNSYVDARTSARAFHAAIKR